MRENALSGGTRAALLQGLRDWQQSEGLLWVFIGKALLSAFLGLWVAYRLELPQPTTVLATVFIVLQRQNGEVLAKSFYRIIGTLTGLSVMVLLIALFNQERVLFLLCLSLWIGCCTAGAARYRDFRGYACVLAGYTAVMIGLPAAHHPDTAFMQALWRVLEIVVGILCTGLVSGLILPQTSSASLRATQRGRFREFTAFATRALRCEVSPEDVESLTVRFATQAVGVDNLLNASAFEDPRIRVRRGRLARLNNEFMVLTTRFHALYQLLQRLPQAPGGRVPAREALEPCLQEVALLLEPMGQHVLSDTQAMGWAEQVARARQALMPQIRLARSGLAAGVQGENDSTLLDFNTAAELLYRLLDDLHSYALTQASLLEHAHPREHFKERFKPRASAWAAVLAGLRCSLLVGALSAFWLATAWPSGDLCVLTVGLVSGLISMTSNPGRLAGQLTVGALGSVLVGFLLQFYVFPWIDGFALLCAVLTPVFALGAWLLGQPRVTGYGIGWLIWFCILSLPANQTYYAPYQFFNSALAVMVAMVAATFMAAVVLPPSRPWLWRQLEHDLRLQVVETLQGRLQGLVTRFESGTRDLLSQAYSSAASQPQVQRHLIRWMFVVQEVGHAIIELRQEQAQLPAEAWYSEEAEWRISIRIMGRALMRLFLHPQLNNWERALEAVDQAIKVTASTPEPCPPQFDTSPLRRVLSYLHFIRSSLLDSRSPLVEEQRHAP